MGWKDAIKRKFLKMAFQRILALKFVRRTNTNCPWDAVVSLKEDYRGCDAHQTKILDYALRAFRSRIDVRQRAKNSQPTAGAVQKYLYFRFSLVISFVNVCEDRCDILPLNIEKCIEATSSPSSRIRDWQVKILDVNIGVRQVASAFNSMYDHKKYERALINSRIALEGRSSVPSVFNRVVKYFAEGSREV